LNFLVPHFVGAYMRQLKGEQANWAQEQFGQARVGDSRRTARLVCMASRAAESPSGKISGVFTQDKERQGAYDLLESGQVDPAALIESQGEAAARLAGSESLVFVAIDGSSLNLADSAACKEFGSVGTLSGGGRGLKVISALGISPKGVPLGLFTQVWWARTQARKQSKKQKRKRNLNRKVEDKETRHWLQAIEAASTRAQATNAKLWFQLDREADNKNILLKLAESGHQFTVRGAWDRVIATTGNDKQYLRQWLDQEAPGGQYMLEVSAGPKRTARLARIIVRWASVTLRLRNLPRYGERQLNVMAVWAREEGTCPAKEKPLDWLLLTSVSVQNFQEAQSVILGYTQRWRIEEFHKTWKTGACNVEQAQLRTQQAVKIWATLLAAVAARIERLKALSRTTPEQPANTELTTHEIRALILLKRQNKKRTEVIPDTMPTIGQATLWIAEMGGYTGKSSGGPPGSITIRRGLDKLLPAANLLQALDAERGSDQW
jgi:hypothetical protein